MKGFSLALLRVSLGLLMIVWAMVKLGRPDAAVGISDKYYWGLFSVADLQMAFGAFQVLLGVLLIIGIFSRFTFPLQALINGFTAFSVWKSIIDPLGLIYGRESVQILFFPSLIVFAACLILIAYRLEDRYSVDGWRRS